MTKRPAKRITAGQLTTIKMAVDALKLALATKNNHLKTNAKQALFRMGWSNSDVQFIVDWHRFPKPPEIDREDWHHAVEFWRWTRGCKSPSDFLDREHRWLAELQEAREAEDPDYGFDPDDPDDVLAYELERQR